MTNQQFKNDGELIFGPITVRQQLRRLIEIFYVNRWDIYVKGVFNDFTS